MSLSEYEIGETIGSGSFGVCRKVVRKRDNKVLVWKELDYGQMSEKEKQMLVSEVNLLRELRHPNIVKYYNRIIDKVNFKLYIIMEYCAGGSLDISIAKHKSKRSYMEESLIIKLFTQILEALQECHDRANKSNVAKIIHRDLKPANIFLDEDLNAKVGDFGLARILTHNTSMATTFVGTPYYMSPEQLSNQAYNDKSDVWSLGCILYEMCTLSPPFLAENQAALTVKIKEGSYKPISSKYSKFLHSAVKRMLQLSPQARPTITELLQLASNDTNNIHNLRSSSANKMRDSIETRAREAQLNEKQQMLTEWESRLNEKEARLEEKERQLRKRDKVTPFEDITNRMAKRIKSEEQSQFNQH